MGHPQGHLHVAGSDLLKGPKLCSELMLQEPPPPQGRWESPDAGTFSVCCQVLCSLTQEVNGRDSL